MRKFFGKILAWIGGFTLCVVLLLFVIVTVARPTKGKVAAKTILELNLETSVLEDVPDDPFLKLSGRTAPSLRDIVEGLEKAGQDSRVSGLIARIGAAPISMAQAQEIRDAVQAFRQQKKFAVAFSETFGEFGPGNGAYYLATAFDEIWLQPSGDVGLLGLMMEPMFLKGAFDKLGLVPRMDHRYEYKNAMNQYVEKKMTPAHREATSKVLNSWFGQLVKGIAAGRKLKEDEVKALIDKGPFLGKEAKDAKLVDGMGYRDEVYAKVKDKAAGAELLFLDKYLDRAGRPYQKGQTVALIYGVGPVVRGKSEFDPFQGYQIMGSDSVSAAIRQAVQDKDVKAILFRVDSPGGSYVASDAIWRETVRARKAGKPLIVSMGSVAGSGGYFVAMAADKIIAQPATITGSIGVLGGKQLTNGFWDKLGISWDEVHAGQNARMFSTTSDFSKEEWARFEAWLDRVYEDFTSKVAEGRKMPKEKILQIAKGRIWSGEDAKANGLVDELGGYPAAIKALRAALKTEDLNLRVYPRKKTTWEAIQARINGDESDSSEARQAEVAIRALESIRPAIRTLRQLGIYGNREEALAMPDLRWIQ